MNGNFVIIMVMCATRAQAKKIAGSLLSKKLVACANIMGGVESKFWWKGSLDRANEALLMMKTKKSNFKKIEAEIKKLHSYEVPEIVAIPIIAGSGDYLSWISSSTR